MARKVSIIIRALGVFLLACALAIRGHAESGEGVAVAIVYDTSGSMKEPVRDSAGKSAPKYVIANRALASVVDRLQKYAGSRKDRKLFASLVVFDGNSAREQVPFGEFKAEPFRLWLKAFNDPKGGTPLGEAVRHASRPVLGSNLKHKHILVITDGKNTTGPDPAAVIPEVRRDGQSKGAAPGIHFIAFDVAGKIFEPLKKLEVTVVSAADEPQLNTQLSYILEEKILLEDEEAPPKKR